MKITLRTNEDDWRELEIDQELENQGGRNYCGHDIPQSVWLDLLAAAGVQIEYVVADFGA